MKRSTILTTAATLAFLTGLIHIVGTLMPVPLEQVEVMAAIETMKATLVPMPIGSAKSYMQILNGNNFGTALLLIVCAGQLIAVAKLPESHAVNRTIAVSALGLAGFALISLTHFFPIPAILTGLAAALCIVAVARENVA